jgi:hypothetical protein
MFLLAAGPGYWKGLAYTTVLRKDGTDSARLIIESVGSWIGLMMAVAVIGLALCSVRLWRHDRLIGAVLLVMTAALFMAPINQLRIHTMQSLNKHVGFGAVFGAIVVGYVLAHITGQRLQAWYRFILPVALIGFAAYLGAQQARVLYAAWPNSSEFMRVLHTLTKPGEEKYLVEDYDLAAYYMDPDIHREQWSGTISFEYTDPSSGNRLTGLDGWTEAVRDRHFSVIALSYSGEGYVDGEIQKTVEATSDYVLVDKILNYGSGYGTGHYWIWKRN